MRETREQPEQQELRFNQEQCDRLKRCADKKDMTEWNDWRRGYSDQDIELEGKLCLSHWYLKGVDLHQLSRDGSGVFDGMKCGRVYLRGVVLDGANLEGANLSNADLTGAGLMETRLERANLTGACLRSACAWSAHFEGAGMKGTVLTDADLQAAHLEGSKITQANLAGANLHIASVDSSTVIWNCRVNRHSRTRKGTDLSGVALDTVKIDPLTKQLIQYNIRRRNWEAWYEEHPRLHGIVRLFWLSSDYGLSTGRIILAFFMSVFAFAVTYYLLGMMVPLGIVDNLFFDKTGVPIEWWIVPLRSLYFSIVTMTTLGFGDMCANPHSIVGHVLLSLQVILGYVLLGAIVTRFAILFSAGGPAGKFADDKGTFAKIKEWVWKKGREKDAR